MTVWLPCIATGTGAEVWTRRLAEGLEARGFRVQLDMVPHRFQYLPWAAPLRAPADCSVTIANSWSAAAFAKAGPLITIVHHVVHDPALAPHKTRAQALFHAGFVAPMERAALRRSTRVIAVSDTTRGAIERTFGFRKAITVLNGVDTGFFVPSLQRNPASEPLKLLFVGKPSRRKGFDFVARLTAELGEKAHLTVIGSEPEHGLSCDRAEWRGRVSREELRRAYQEADVLLLPSHVEGFGYAAAEAMACGTPVLCAPDGAVREIAGSAAIVAELADPTATARKLLTLRDDADLHLVLRNAARQNAVRSLSETRWLDAMVQLVAEVQAVRTPVTSITPAIQF